MAPQCRFGKLLFHMAVMPVNLKCPQSCKTLSSLSVVFHTSVNYHRSEPCSSRPLILCVHADIPTGLAAERGKVASTNQRVPSIASHPWWLGLYSHQ